MGFLDYFKKSKQEQAATKAPVAGKAQASKPKAVIKKEDKPKKKEALHAAKKDTKDAYKVLIKPLITEKATRTNTYLFAVNPKTNKQEVAKAVHAVYGVWPAKVNITNFSGKSVRWGRSAGKTVAWKKAVVYLKPNDKIEVFEGV
ncbi:MAG: 50S ribosomal protein L23 [Patescibacteria group bacterium]|jgi:large subunit ribosomal protein L23